jgi:hypothetical protein
MKIINKHEEDELEFWHDYKVKGKDVRFPEHSNKQSSKVTTYKIEELINK